MSEAEKLKAEGNDLFSKKDFASAIVKYSKAIALDDKNAILFANRSACQRALKRYTEALADAITATELDPSYSKAWGRVGDAAHLIGNDTRSVYAYKKALSTLPQSGTLSPAEAKQKAQYEEGLKISQDIVDTPPAILQEVNPDVREIDLTAGNAPWDIATKMIPELIRTQNIDSSAWTLNAAYIELTSALKTMKQTKRVKNSQGVALYGDTGALSLIVNSLLSNERVFAIDGDWLPLFEQQMQLEASHYKPWPSHVSPSQIIAQAPGRVSKEGWRPVRMAMNMNVRHWIMKGWLDGALMRNFDQKVENFKNALTVMTWGARTWKDVPLSDKGSIFTPTFMNGTRRLYLDAILSNWGSSPPEEKDFLLSLLATESRELIQDIQSAGIPSDTDATGAWAFYKNCLGTAYACLSFYHCQRANEAIDDEGKQEHMHSAADLYLKAAGQYASDDEHHTWYLHCALMYLKATSAPAAAQLAVVMRLKVALPKMRQLWCANPVMATPSKDEGYAADLAMESSLRSQLS